MMPARVRLYSYIFDYENNRDVSIIIVMVMFPLYNLDCILRTMKNSALVLFTFPCLNVSQQLSCNKYCLS